MGKLLFVSVASIVSLLSIVSAVTPPITPRNPYEWMRQAGRYKWRHWTNPHWRRVRQRAILWRKDPNYVAYRKKQADRCRRLKMTYSGRCNNLLNPDWGRANTPMIMLYGAPRTAAPSGLNRPNPRRVSNVLAATGDSSLPNNRGMSQMVMFFGQFLDHTVTRTSKTTTPMPIVVPKNDKMFTPGEELKFFRTKRKWTRTEYIDGYSPINSLSSYIDAASIYGNTEGAADFLRLNKSGRLRRSGTSDQDFLPRNERSGMFMSGDSRVNENPGLVVMHTLLFREHNRACAEILKAFPFLHDNTVFRLARRIVVAQLQAATYFDFLPAMLGKNAMPKYKGYNDQVNADVSVEFSTVAFRVGHTLIRDDITVINEAGRIQRIPLKEAFFNPRLLDRYGLNPIVRGMMRGRASEVDVLVSPMIRNFLLESPRGKQTFDLFSINIQRGRDQAVASYNDLRKILGLRRVRSFAEITKNTKVAAALKELYRSVDDIDAYVGGLAEDHVPDASVGPLFQRIWMEQFTRMRDGDRFYFQRPASFTAIEQQKLPTVKFLSTPNFQGGAIRRIILMNTSLKPNEINPNPLFV